MAPVAVESLLRERIASSVTCVYIGKYMKNN